MDIWNKKIHVYQILCAICVCILRIFVRDKDNNLLRSFWHYRHCSTTNTADSRTTYFLVQNVPKKSFLLWWSLFPSRNILSPSQRIEKETFSNNLTDHIAALAGAFGVREERKSLRVPVFSKFQFQKTRKSNHLFAAKHKPVKKNPQMK